jgi:transposase
MKVTTTAVKVNPDHYLNVNCDVHKDELYFLAAVPGTEYTDQCANRTRVVERKLKEFAKIAHEHGKATIRVVCEPTGEYDRVLLRTAHRLGFMTAAVNTENVKRFRQIETNDNGKTDTKDPRVIASLADQERVIRVRNLDEKYLTLRKLGAVAEYEEIAVVRLKNQLHRELFNLFCDYDMKKDFLYTSSGRALVMLYGCNPYRIVRAGFSRFQKRMRKAAKGIRVKTVERLWDAAESSVLHELPARYVKAVEEQIRELHADCTRHIERKEKIEQQMIDLLNEIRAEDPNIPPPTPRVISEKNLAKLLAETGCPGDFESWRQLLRYGGLNLCERESGKYQGITKISKKGRSRMRKILGNIVLPLVPRHKLYGPFYRQKCDVDRMCGNKAMTVTMRNFLRKFWGWYRSGGGEFDETRWFSCESKMEKAA